MIPASVPSAPLAAPRTEEELEDRLSRPNAAVVEALRQSPGDRSFAILGICLVLEVEQGKHHE